MSARKVENNNKYTVICAVVIPRGGTIAFSVPQLRPLEGFKVELVKVSRMSMVEGKTSALSNTIHLNNSGK